MDSPTVTVIQQAAPGHRALRHAWSALVLVAACGGTTAHENIGSGDASPGLDASPRVDASSGLDASGVDATSADGNDPDRAATIDSGRLPTDGGTPEGASLVTTETVLDGLSPDCLDFETSDASDAAIPIGCIVDNGCLDLAQSGGTCENPGPSGYAVDGGPPLPHLSGMLPGTTQTCADILGREPVSETAVCLKTLASVFSCATSIGELTRCLCGTTDPAMCLAGTATPTGALFDTYACDIGDPDGSTINSAFTDPHFGVGVANALAQCVGAFVCPCCFAGSARPDGGACRPPPKAP
jgi:hypothetical protein